MQFVGTLSGVVKAENAQQVISKLQREVYQLRRLAASSGLHPDLVSTLLLNGVVCACLSLHACVCVCVCVCESE